MDRSVGNPNTEETMEYEDTGEVQYVYDESQMILGGSNDFNNITDLILEDGTRAMIVDGTLVTADGQTLILRDGSDLSQYYVDDNTDHIVLSQEQEEQFLEIISSQNPQTDGQVVQYVQSNDDAPHVKEESGRVIYIQEGDQILPAQEEYQLAEVNSGNSEMPIQVVKLENDQVTEEIEDAIDLEQFLSQQGIMQLEGGNYQYAVLKEGKFHIQTMNDPTDVEILKDQNVSDVENDSEVLGPSTELSCLDLSIIKGKNINTGESISLSKYMYTHNKAKYLRTKRDNGKIKYEEKKHTTNSTSNTISTDLKKLINKKITIGKTDKGKVLIGKIINVTKKTEATTHIFNKDQNTLQNNITIKKEIILPHKEKPKSIFNVAVKQVINVVDDKDTRIRKTIGQNNLQNANSCARTNNPKMVPVASNKIVNQNNKETSITNISSNSESNRTTSSAGTSILKPKRLIYHPPDETAAQNNQTLSSEMPVPITVKKEVLCRTEDEREDCFGLMSPDVETSTEQSKIVVHKKVVTKDCFEVITRTLTGLMNMESVVKKLKNKTIIIKIIEKNYDQNTGDFSKSISYCTGYMVREYKLDEDANNFSESWRFIPDTNSKDTILGEDNLESILQDRSSGHNNLKKIANLTIQITVNLQGSRTTRVIINPPNMYKCKDCTKSFRTSSALKVHMNECHSPDSLECTSCSIKLTSAQESKEHFLIHQVDDSKGMYKCMECRKQFMTSSLLSKHMDLHFTPVTCQHCNQGFSNIMDLKKHLAVHEQIISPPPSATQNVNMKPHEQKIYCCHICGRQFSRHSNLQRHIEIHQGEGALYKCVICSCSYHYVSSLTRHVVTCHVDTTNKRSQKKPNEMKSIENTNTEELKYLQEDQIVEMIRLEDMSAENLQYVTEAIGDVTESLRVGEGVEVLHIPVGESGIVIEN